MEYSDIFVVSPSLFRNILSAADVYSCRRFESVLSESDSGMYDWAVVILDRAVVSLEQSQIAYFDYNVVTCSNGSKKIRSEYTVSHSGIFRILLDIRRHR